MTANEIALAFAKVQTFGLMSAETMPLDVGACYFALFGFVPSCSQGAYTMLAFAEWTLQGSFPATAEAIEGARAAFEREAPALDVIEALMAALVTVHVEMSFTRRALELVLAGVLPPGAVTLTPLECEAA